MAGRIELMQRAIDEARKGMGRTSPNPMVGCVIVRDRRIVAVGHTQPPGRAHAEIVALERAGRRARGADVYVNLEPCCHEGKTGPCTEALIAAGVRRVFVGIRDPNPLVNGKGMKRLRQAGIEVDTGLLATECLELNEDFVFAMRHRRPFVVAKVAQSLDGRVATRLGESQWITSVAARRVGHALRARWDAIVVGVGTILADNPLLTCRMKGGRDPVRVILDSQARTPPQARILRQSSAAGTWIVVGSGAAHVRCQRLERAGAHIMRLPTTKQGGIALSPLLRELYRQGVLSVLVEGGPSVLGSFFDANLVNKVEWFVAPRVLGGETSLGAVGGKGVGKLSAAVQLRQVRVAQLGGDLHVTGYLATGR